MNHKDAKIQSDYKNNELIGDEGSLFLSHVMIGLEDIKQGHFSDKNILDIGAEND